MLVPWSIQFGLKCKTFVKFINFPVQRIAAGGGLLGGQRKSRVAATWLDQSNGGGGVAVAVAVGGVGGGVGGVGGVGSSVVVVDDCDGGMMVCEPFSQIIVMPVTVRSRPRHSVTPSYK